MIKIQVIKGTAGAESHAVISLEELRQALKPLYEGTVWYSDHGAPNPTLGKSGDFYLRKSNGDIYQKGTDGWSVVMNIMGPKGEKGDQGEPGKM